MNREEDTNRLADDLESLRIGTLSEQEFRAKWMAAAVQELLSVIWPNLEHYFADLDIRERDPAYCVRQDTEMQRLVRLLRTGASATELAKVTFIGR